MRNKRFRKPQERKVQILYRDNPFRSCTYTRHKNRSFTDCRESYQHGASKETLILRWNNRIPTQEFVLHFKTVFSAEEIREYRTQIFRVLKDNGLEAVASIELTLGKDGKPNNTIHFHVITDDIRHKKELRQLLEMACERQGLINKKDFCITYESLDNGYWRFSYFTKLGEKYFDEVILFQPGLLESGRTLQKFYQIGNWFYKPKKEIWDDIKAYMAAKNGSDPDKKGFANETEQEAINDVAFRVNGKVNGTKSHQ